ncbi:hypothetical protein HHK36_024015 [Tetracentron sinense]|uniref:Uncharacterized protein n=1 Tax=Tetracentron sinense TaxID=13715 RepID=A0A834YR89_TETSI|nr:hypothetical protein HHK36_024015 [Tetracentron sinense]
MAEGLVYFLLENMVSLLEEEASFQSGIRSDVKGLRDSLKSMVAFLREAEGMEVGPALKDRVKQVQELAYDVDDVLDHFMLQVSHSNRHKFTEPLRRPARTVKRQLTWRKFFPKIKDLKERIDSIINRDKIRFTALQTGSSSTTARKDPRVAYPVIEDSKIVGIKKPMEELSRLLYAEESSCSWISVVGVGGLGKTTLAKKVYTSSEVKKDFSSHAWIDMSQPFNSKELLQRLLKELFREWWEPLPEGVDNMETGTLIEQLRNFLQPKRYVVVFDDVWCIDVLESIKSAFADSIRGNGSRVMLITRSHEIASKCDHVYNLRPLLNKEAWNLFCMMAFRSPGDQGFCPPELEASSKKIVEFCEGLPLAIVSIGDFLSKKEKTMIEWEKLHNGLGYELERNNSLSCIPAALLLSYNNLPYHLKPCFLYFSVFPQSFKVKCSRLIRLWIAEGFVQRKEGKTLEEVADDYLNKLISGNLVEVAGRDFDGPPRTCRVHSIMHMIILLKSKEENFSSVYADQNMDSQHGKIRRLSILHNCNNINENMSFTDTRAFFLFQEANLFNSSTSRRFSSLKVLDLQDAPIVNFPDENLPRLRYLSLRNTNIRELPKSLGNSRNLETLDLKKTNVSVLPTNILSLQYLRHLLVCGKDRGNCVRFNYVQGLKLPAGIQHLNSLHSLSFVKPEGDRHIIRELENLVELRKLGVEVKREDWEYLCLSIQKMKNLNTFDVASANMEEVLVLDLHARFTPPPSLQRLYLKGRLEKVPNWISQLSRLVKISLKWSRLSRTPLGAIQALPSLMELQLVDAYTGQELVFEAGWFQKLKILELDQFHQLNTVTVQDQTMPGLQKLTIRRCKNMKMVPVGIIYLTRLKALNLYEMPEDLVITLDKNRGVDHLMGMNVLTSSTSQCTSTQVLLIPQPHPNDRLS